MNSSISYNFADILSKFSIEGSVAEVTPFGSGHINSTFYVKNIEEGKPDYLLQRINDYVFKDVPALTENVKLVIEHLRKKVEANNGNAETEVLTLVPCKNSLYYYKDTDANYWRIYIFLKDTKSYDLLETEEQAYEGGKAFGNFQSLLSDMDATLLVETIPNFLNIESRLKNFQKSINDDLAGRVKDCKVEIDYLMERAEKMSSILNLAKEGKLPLRITHNDTKFNNVLLNKDDKAQCVIDLDTVMPGYTAYDYGCAIRTVINTASEDEADLSKINLNIDLFKAYTRGYLAETINSLTDYEMESLMLGVLVLPYIQVMRFLTDHLDGDKYYKIHFPGHNLQRTRSELQLLKKLEENQEVLETLIHQIASESKATASIIS